MRKLIAAGDVQSCLLGTEDRRIITVIFDSTGQYVAEGKFLVLRRYFHVSVFNVFTSVNRERVGYLCLYSEIEKCCYPLLME